MSGWDKAVEVDTRVGWHKAVGTYEGFGGGQYQVGGRNGEERGLVLGRESLWHPFITFEPQYSRCPLLGFTLIL